MTTPAPSTHAAIALAEFTRRRALARAGVSAGRTPLAAAESHVRLWAGIAAWFGAVLPTEVRPYDGWQSWLDHAPRGSTAASWRSAIAAELRRAAEGQLKQAEGHGQSPPTPETITRARALLALDNELSIAAGLPPIGAASEPERQAA